MSMCPRCVQCGRHFMEADDKPCQCCGETWQGDQGIDCPECHLCYFCAGSVPCSICLPTLPPSERGEVDGR